MLDSTVYLLVGLVSVYYLLLLVLPQYRRKDSEPPLKGILFIKDFSSVIQTLRKKHGSIFTIVTFGNRMHFITDIKSIRKIWATPRYFNFSDFASTVESRFSGMETKEEIYATGVSNAQFSKHAHSMRGVKELEKLVARLESALNEAVDSVGILHCEEWQTVSLREFTALMVWYAAGRSLFGKGWLKGVDVLDSLRQYAVFEDKAPFIIGGLPKFIMKKGLYARDYLTRNVLLPLVQLNGGKMEEGHPYIQLFLDELKVPYEGKSDGDLKIAARLNGLLFGINTNTMNLIFWTVARLLTSPKELQQRLQEEISETMKKYSTWKDIKANTPLLTSLIIETLRFHGDPGSFRVVEQNCSVSGLGEDGSKTFHFRKGDSVFLRSTYDQLKNVEGPNPDEFNGSRWLRYTTNPNLSSTSSSGLFPLPPSQVLAPFGGGKHLCPGRFFALIELHYVVAFCLNHYEFRLIETSKLPPKVVDLSVPINQPKEKMMIQVRWKKSKKS